MEVYSSDIIGSSGIPEAVETIANIFGNFEREFERKVELLGQEWINWKQNMFDLTNNMFSVYVKDEPTKFEKIKIFINDQVELQFKKWKIIWEQTQRKTAVEQNLTLQTKIDSIKKDLETVKRDYFDSHGENMEELRVKLEKFFSEKINTPELQQIGLAVQELSKKIESMSGFDFEEMQNQIFLLSKEIKRVGKSEIEHKITTYLNEKLDKQFQKIEKENLSMFEDKFNFLFDEQNKNAVQINRNFEDVYDNLNVINKWKSEFEQTNREAFGVLEKQITDKNSELVMELRNFESWKKNIEILRIQMESLLEKKKSKSSKKLLLNEIHTEILKILNQKIKNGEIKLNEDVKKSLEDMSFKHLNSRLEDNSIDKIISDMWQNVNSKFELHENVIQNLISELETTKNTINTIQTDFINKTEELSIDDSSVWKEKFESLVSDNIQRLNSLEPLKNQVQVLERKLLDVCRKAEDTHMWKSLIEKQMLDLWNVSQERIDNLDIKIKTIEENISNMEQKHRELEFKIQNQPQLKEIEKNLVFIEEKHKELESKLSNQKVIEDMIKDVEQKHRELEVKVDKNQLESVENAISELKERYEEFKPITDQIRIVHETIEELKKNQNSSIVEENIFGIKQKQRNLEDQISGIKDMERLIEEIIEKQKEVEIPVKTQGDSILIGNVVHNSEIPVTKISNVYGNKTAIVDSPMMVFCDNNGQLGTNTSSIEQKENIENIGSTSAVLHRLRPVSFTYKQDTNKNIQYGLIGEEVEKVFPDLVCYDKNDKIIGVSYHKLIPLILNEIKGLKKDLEQMRNMK